jgi:hypothetical protein
MWMIKRYGNLWRFCNEGRARVLRVQPLPPGFSTRPARDSFTIASGGSPNPALRPRSPDRRDVDSPLGRLASHCKFPRSASATAVTQIRHWDVSSNRKTLRTPRHRRLEVPSHRASGAIAPVAGFLYPTGAAGFPHPSPLRLRR